MSSWADESQEEADRRANSGQDSVGFKPMPIEDSGERQDNYRQRRGGGGSQQRGGGGQRGGQRGGGRGRGGHGGGDRGQRWSADREYEGDSHDHRYNGDHHDEDVTRQLEDAVRDKLRIGSAKRSNGASTLTSDDLRHRLNQRSREPERPKQPPQEEDSGHGGQGQQQQRRQHSRLQGRGGGFGGQGGLGAAQQLQQQQQQRPKEQQIYQPKQAAHAHSGNNSRQRIRNTENFNPSYEPAQMRILCATPGLDKYDRESTSRDVIVVSDLFCQKSDLSIYNRLMEEISNSGVDPDRLWQLWHGDSHVIADDKTQWKHKCPTFKMVLDRLASYFDMDIKATRFNWYRNSTEWKPFHHDAAAVKPDKARTQNFTAAVSFGAERDAAFEHAHTKVVISMPQPNGTVYTFGKDVNVLWRHGIPQVHPDNYSEQGRISIIAWGWINQVDV